MNSKIRELTAFQAKLATLRGCPQCGGLLALRHSGNRTFFACENYRVGLPQGYCWYSILVPKNEDELYHEFVVAENEDERLPLARQPIGPWVEWHRRRTGSVPSGLSMLSALATKKPSTLQH